MAKRELIDKEEVKDVLGDTINSEGDYRHALRLLDGLSAKTEQEIVKPYLENLKEQIRYDYNRNIWGQYEYEKVMDLINNLLSEQEG